MNVLVILGHPRTDSYCAALAEAYCVGAREAGVNIRQIVLAEMEFEPHAYEHSPSRMSGNSASKERVI